MRAVRGVIPPNRSMCVANVRFAVPSQCPVLARSFPWLECRFLPRGDLRRGHQVSVFDHLASRKGALVDLLVFKGRTCQGEGLVVPLSPSSI
jgi:hypothetical protein